MAPKRERKYLSGVGVDSLTCIQYALFKELALREARTTHGLLTELNSLMI